LMSKINLQRGKLTVENRKSREKKRICSEVSVNSPGNPWSQFSLYDEAKGGNFARIYDNFVTAEHSHPSANVSEFNYAV